MYLQRDCWVFFSESLRQTALLSPFEAFRLLEIARSFFTICDRSLREQTSKDSWLCFDHKKVLIINQPTGSQPSICNNFFELSYLESITFGQNSNHAVFGQVLTEARLKFSLIFDFQFTKECLKKIIVPIKFGLFCSIMKETKRNDALRNFRFFLVLYSSSFFAYR